MSTVNLDESERKAHQIADWDEERDAPDQQCVACRAGVRTPSGLVPTALCNFCAQAYAADTAPVVIALVARIRELQQVSDEALTYWASLCPLDAGRIGQLREILEKGIETP